MANSLKTMFLIMIFAGLVTMQYNIDADKTSTRQIKNALELAVHDAALALDESQLYQGGKIVFDQAQALDNLKVSLNTNLKLTSSGGYYYIPQQTSFYKEDLFIEHIEFIDDSNATFPMPYTNATYNILDTLNGPSIVAVLTTKSPRYFTGEGITIRKAVVYEYN